MFKVGDKVVRTVPCGFGSDHVGKVRVVTKVASWCGYECLALEGENNEAHDGCPFLANLYRHAKYSEYFTQATSQPAPTGHVADNPIQKHSVGTIYPLAVVCYADGDKQRFVIENLERGEVALSSSGDVLQWNRSGNAYVYATLRVGAAKWGKGRPVYGPHGGLIMPVEVKQPSRSVLDIIQVNDVYYKALEQDIG